MATCFIGIGSNIDSEKNLQKAAALLRKKFPEISFSSVYQSAPMHYEEQDTFLNAVALLETDEEPEALLATLQEIEISLRKNLPHKFGPRTIDLDILLYGKRCVRSDDITIPHPRMHARRFVLDPLCELINPTTIHPVLGKPWNELQKSTCNQECQQSRVIL